MAELKPFRVLVTGSRVISPGEARFVEQILTRHCAEAIANLRRVVIVNGECRTGGVDRAAERWAGTTTFATSEGHPADWEQHGKAAGPIRNAHMVSLGADLCIAFPRPGSAGTWDCLKKAADAGIPGIVYPLAGSS